MIKSYYLWSSWASVLQCYRGKNLRDLKYLDRSTGVTSSCPSNLCLCLTYELGRFVWVSFYSQVCVAQFTDWYKAPTRILHSLIKGSERWTIQLLVFLGLYVRKLLSPDGMKLFFSSWKLLFASLVWTNNKPKKRRGRKGQLRKNTHGGWIWRSRLEILNFSSIRGIRT